MTSYLQMPPDLGVQDWSIVWIPSHAFQTYFTSNTAQGGGGSFTIERFVAVKHGWQSEPTDGSEGPKVVGAWRYLAISQPVYQASLLR